MGRAVAILDEAGVVQHCEQRLFATPEAGELVGLLIGRHRSAADAEEGQLDDDYLVAGLIPTPLPTNEDDEKPTKGKGKKKPQLSPVDALDAEWMTEHAHQVDRMLPGGLSIVGAYLYASSKSSAGYLPKMHQLLYSIREAAGYRGKQHGGPSSLLLLQIMSDTKKFSVSAIDITNRKGETKPVDMKHQSFVASLQCFVCAVDVSVTIPVASGQNPRDQIEAALKAEADTIRGGLFMINRKPVDETSPIHGNKKQGKGDSKGKQKSKLAKATKQLPSHAVYAMLPRSMLDRSRLTFFFDLQRHTVEILTEGLSSSSLDQTPSDGGGIGSFTYSGSIHGRAYCHPKDTYGQAIEALKADLTKSLTARFDFLCEELERREADVKQSKKKAASSSFNPFGDDAAKLAPKFEQTWGLPQRVFFPFVGPLLMADYLMPFETIKEDCCERAKALLDLQPSEKDFVTPERFISDSLTVDLSSSAEKTAKPASRKKEPKIEVVAAGEDRAEDEDKETTMLLSPRLQPEESSTASGTLQGMETKKSSNALFLGVALAALIAVLALVASLGIAETSTA